jgi:hypothetical protein
MFALLLLAVVMVPAATPSAQITTGPSAADKNVPGSFHPYNVTAREVPLDELDASEREELEKGRGRRYTSRGKFHCLVTEYDLDPVVMLVARGLDESKGFHDLLTRLEETIVKDRASRLRAFVVFLDDDPKTDYATQDEKREERARKIEQLGEKLKLRNVVLTLGSKSDLKKYALDDTAALSAIQYRNLRIVSSRTASRDELESAGAPAIKTILDDTTGKLLSRR